MKRKKNQQTAHSLLPNMNAWQQFWCLVGSGCSARLGKLWAESGWSCSSGSSRWAFCMPNTTLKMFGFSDVWIWDCQPVVSFLSLKCKWTLDFVLMAMWFFVLCAGSQRRKKLWARNTLALLTFTMMIICRKCWLINREKTIFLTNTSNARGR